MYLAVKALKILEKITTKLLGRISIVRSYLLYFSRPKSLCNIYVAMERLLFFGERVRK